MLRTALFGLALLWTFSFAFSVYLNETGSGTIFGLGPVEAHDLPDLIVWAAIQVWLYVTPLGLALAWFAIRRPVRN